MIEDWALRQASEVCKRYFAGACTLETFGEAFEYAETWGTRLPADKAMWSALEVVLLHARLAHDFYVTDAARRHARARIRQLTSTSSNA